MKQTLPNPSPPYPPFPVDAIATLVNVIKNPTAQKDWPALFYAEWLVQGFAQSQILGGGPVLAAASVDEAALATELQVALSLHHSGKDASAVDWKSILSMILALALQWLSNNP